MQAIVSVFLPVLSHSFHPNNHTVVHLLDFLSVTKGYEKEKIEKCNATAYLVPLPKSAGSYLGVEK